MKIKGIIMVNPLMSQMEVGQTGFLIADAITVMNNCEIFINTNKSISQIKNVDANYTIPITRIGAGKDDFEIDFFITTNFFNNEVDEEIKRKYLENQKMIGPFPIEVEIYRALNYREQLYPRMDLTELIQDLIITNQYLDPDEKNETYLEDKKILQKCIKTKLKKLDLTALKHYEKTFTPLTEEESEGGEIVNYAENVWLSNFVIARIETLEMEQELDSLSIDELQIKMGAANKEENFEQSALIRDIIEKKK